MRYTVTSLAEIGTAFAGFATYLEERATHAPQQREREILRARAGTWREAARVVSATDIPGGAQRTMNQSQPDGM